MFPYSRKWVLTLTTALCSVGSISAAYANSSDHSPVPASGSGSGNSLTLDTNGAQFPSPVVKSEALLEAEKSDTSEPLTSVKQAKPQTGITKPIIEKAVRSFNISLPALIDGIYLGDVDVRVQGEDIFVPAEKMIDLLRAELVDAALATLNSAALDGELQIGTFKVQGFDLVYNSALQQIEVNSDLDNRQRREIRLGAAPLEDTGPTVKPGKVALFVNPTASIGYNWNPQFGQDKGFQSVRGSIDMGGRLFGEKGVGFFTRQTYDTNPDQGLPVIRREESVAYYDMLDGLMRVSAGDLRARGQGFQSIPRMAGISLERFFQLEPSRLFRPIGETQFELERPSTIEVRINGITRREITLPPGRYDLADLPLTQGSNYLELVIRDDLGREQIVSEQNFYDFGLLEEGVFDFSLAAGVKAQQGRNAPSYTDEPIITAFIRRGMTKNLTMEADIQGDRNGVNTGLGALYASPIGTLRLEGAFSEYEAEGSGYAGEIAYRLSGLSNSDGWRYSLSASARQISGNFTAVQSADADLINTIDIDAGVTAGSGGLTNREGKLTTFNGAGRLSKGRWSAIGSANYTMTESGLDRQTYVGGITYQLFDNISVSALARHINDGLEKENSGIFQLTWRPGRGKDFRISYDSAFQQLDARYSKSALARVGAFNYSINSQNNLEFDTNSLSGNVFYTGNRFDGNLDHSLIQTDEGGLVQNTRLTLGTSLVMVDGAFGMGRPVENSFVVFDRHESLKDKTIILNPTESGHHGKSDFFGAPILSEGGAFGRRTTYYDVEDLPIGYDLGAGQFTTSPPAFSGYRVKIGSGASFTMVGRVLKSKTGEIMPYIGGKLEKLDGDEVGETYSAFTNRNGRLAATGLLPGRYSLKLFTKKGHSQEVVIPDSSNPLIDIGDIRVETDDD